MTISEFSKITESKLYEKIVNYLTCIIVIFISIFFLIKFSELKINQTNWQILSFVWTFSLLLMVSGIYGIVFLAKPLKISYLKNELTEEKNIELIKEIYNSLNGKDLQIDNNLIQFKYKKDFWSYRHGVYLLAENNLIAIIVNIKNSNAREGFADFGQSSKLQKKILNILEQASS